MKDTYGKKLYTCKCGSVTEGYVWFGKIKETQFECTKCGKWLGYDNLKQDKPTSIISIRTPTKTDNMKTPLQQLMQWFNERPEYDKSSEGYEIMQKAQELLKAESDFAREAYILGHYDSSLDIYNPSECYGEITK